MFPSRVKYVLTFFDALGYNSGSSMLSNRRATANLICFLHILLAVFFSCVTFYLNMLISPHTRLVDLLNQLLQYSSTLYMYWFTIWDSFYHWREHHRFWAIFRQINESFQSQCNFTHRTFTLKVFSIVLPTIVSVSILLLTIGIPHPMNKILIINVILIKLCQFRVFYYLFCLEAINFQLKSIDSALKRMCERVNFESDSDGVHRLKCVQQYYHCVLGLGVNKGS